MARYRALKRCYINETLFEAGQIVVVMDDFPPDEHLEPLDDAATAAFETFERRPVPTDPEYFRLMVENGTDAKPQQPQQPARRKG